MSNLVQIEVVIPYTPNGGGNLAIEREDGLWIVSSFYEHYVCYSPSKDKRKVRNQIYRYVRDVRKQVGSIDNASWLFSDNGAPSYNDL